MSRQETAALEAIRAWGVSAASAMEGAAREAKKIAAAFAPLDKDPEDNLVEWRERAEFWASRDPDSGLYDKNAVAFANDVVALLDRLGEVSNERDEWQGQVVGIRAQQREALARADAAEAGLRDLHFRVDAACSSYEHLLDDDVPSSDDKASYQNGAERAARGIRDILASADGGGDVDGTA